jgi:hypothetical protein
VDEAPLPVQAPLPVPDIVGVTDPAATECLARDGYARLGPLLSAAEVARAREVFDEAFERLDRPLGDAWFPTILLPDDDVRAFITTELEALIAPKLEAVLDGERTELLRLDFSVKPPSESSELGPHQDFSLVDERHATGLYVWIPLEDTDASNGTLHVVPGSHRFSNKIRSQHVPATFDDVIDLVHGESVRLDCSAGELILMVSGVIHHSPPNRSDRVRLAAHGIVRPTEVPLVFYFADESTPEDMVECYEMDLERYVRHIHQGRPGPEAEMTEMVRRPPTGMTRERFREGIAAVRPTSD